MMTDIFHGPTMAGYRDRVNPYGGMPSPEHVACAAHEAAHAIVGAALGHRVDEVTIERRPHGRYSWQGRCEHTGPHRAGAVEHDIEHAIITAAPLAGRDALDGHTRMWEPDGGLFESDARSMHDAAESLGMAYGDLRRHAVAIAGKHLRAHAAEWRDLTYRLMRAETLDTDDLTALYPDLFPAEPAAALPTSTATATRSQPARNLPDINDLTPAQRNRIAAALEQLLDAHRGHTRAPGYRVGSQRVETRVNRPGYETRGVA